MTGTESPGDDRSMRVIVCGSREWVDRQAISDRLAELPPGDVNAGTTTVVVHGMARGADRIADQEARKLGLFVEPYPADWDTPLTPEEMRVYGKKGQGFKRNEHMASLGADLCIAFWDGLSNGTKDMMARARAHGIPVDIVMKGAS